jgi:UDP-N-acetylmuramoylalanine--D-glutamate ligase
MTRWADWHGWRFVVVGLGRSGIAAAQLLRRLGAHVRATDSQDTAATRAARTLLKFCGVEDVELGTHSKSLMLGADAVVVSPGVPETAMPIRWAHEHEVPVWSEVELAYRCCESPIVAVTGTNGKSTAVTLIAGILQAARRPAIACGNLGTPFSSILDQLTPRTTVVLEVSSFQLMGCDTFRPDIGVFLNIGTNHLDRHQDRDAYLAAKLKLFARQTAEDWAVVNADPAIAGRLGRIRARTVWFGEARTGPTLRPTSWRRRRAAR